MFGSLRVLRTLRRGRSSTVQFPAPPSGLNKKGHLFRGTLFYLILVDQPGHCAHQDYIDDFLEFDPKPKTRKSNKIPKRYLESKLSAQQIADEFGVSKQFVLTQLRSAGIKKTSGRGRSPENYRFHNPPYGHRVEDGRLVINNKELKIARLIVELRDRRRLSFEAIAKDLNERGHPTRRGTVWHRVSVRRVHKGWTGKI